MLHFLLFVPCFLLDASVLKGPFATIPRVCTYVVYRTQDAFCAGRRRNAPPPPPSFPCFILNRPSYIPSFFSPTFNPLLPPPSPHSPLGRKEKGKKETSFLFLLFFFRERARTLPASFPDVMQKKEQDRMEEEEVTALLFP